MERVLFAPVANRAIEPMSKLSARSGSVRMPSSRGCPRWTTYQAYRAMVLLAGAVQEAVFFAAASLPNLEVGVLFLDTTSACFERDEEDGGEDGCRRHGKSKDHLDDLPQIVIGLAVTHEGIPVRIWS
jgi:hypothetical protein